MMTIHRLLIQTTPPKIAQMKTVATKMVEVGIIGGRGFACLVAGIVRVVIMVTVKFVHHLKELQCVVMMIVSVFQTDIVLHAVSMERVRAVPPPREQQYVLSLMRNVSVFQMDIIGIVVIIFVKPVPPVKAQPNVHLIQVPVFVCQKDIVGLVRMAAGPVHRLRERQLVISMVVGVNSCFSLFAHHKSRASSPGFFF